MFSLALLLATITINAQTYTIECLKNQLTDKSGNCIDCDGQDELFTGLSITRPNGVRQKIYAPFKTKWTGEVVSIRDAYGNGMTTNVNNITTYDTIPDLITYLEGCNLNPTQGAFYLMADSTLTTTAGLSNIAGWSFPVDSGDIYEVELIGQGTCATSTSGIYIGLKTSGSGILIGHWLTYVDDGDATPFRGNISAISTSYSTTNGGYVSSTGLTTIHPLLFKAIFRATADGTVSAGWGRETAVATVVKAGTTLTYKKLN
mgnify:CR=1 FL=1